MYINSHLEIFSRLQAIEKSRQFLLFQTDTQKTVVGCPTTRQDKKDKTKEN